MAGRDVEITACVLAQIGMSRLRKMAQMVVVGFANAWRCDVQREGCGAGWLQKASTSALTPASSVGSGAAKACHPSQSQASALPLRGLTAAQITVSNQTAKTQERALYLQVCQSGSAIALAEEATGVARQAWRSTEPTHR